MARVKKLLLSLSLLAILGIATELLREEYIYRQAKKQFIKTFQALKYNQAEDEVIKQMGTPQARWIPDPHGDTAYPFRPEILYWTINTKTGRLWQGLGLTRYRRYPEITAFVIGHTLEFVMIEND